MAQVAEYRDIKGEGVSRRDILADGFSSKLNRTVRLVSATRGWEPAGAMARWTDGFFAVHYLVDGIINGRRYRTIEEARAHFNKLID